MSPQLNTLAVAGTDPELRFLTPVQRAQCLLASHPALTPLIEPVTPLAPLVCLIFPVTEDQPAESPERQDDAPVEPASPTESGSDTRH